MQELVGAISSVTLEIHLKERLLKTGYLKYTDGLDQRIRLWLAASGEVHII